MVHPTHFSFKIKLFICGFENFAIFLPDYTSIVLIHFAFQHYRLFFSGLHAQKGLGEFVREFWFSIYITYVKRFPQTHKQQIYDEILPINLRWHEVLIFCLSILQLYSPLSSLIGPLKMRRQVPVRSLLISNLCPSASIFSSPLYQFTGALWWLTWHSSSNSRLR